MADMESEIEDFEKENDDVDLGFAEKCDDSILLSSLFFPSKLGGRPGWLRFDALPASDQLTCGNCEKQLVFLCQVYVPHDEIRDDESLPLKQPNNKSHDSPCEPEKAPLDNNTPPESQHRMVYLFCCRNGMCSKRKSFVKAFRTQKAQSSSDIVKEEEDKSKLKSLLKEAESQQSLCVLCGCLASKTCSSCHKVSYCCKDHQAVDWKDRHKKECSNDSADVTRSIEDNPLLFNEWEIVIEGEPAEQTSKQTDQHDKLSHDSTEKLDENVEKFAKLKEDKVDEYFSNFRERIDREPEQIIRYDLGGAPLWVSSENIPRDEDIPNCGCCGSKRQFEFQVLPQMLNYLGVETTVESIDWGTLCVYSCMRSCTGGDNPYKEEFVWKQDVSQHESNVDSEDEEEEE